MLLSHGRLSREPGDARPIEIVFDTHRVWRLELRVADGDDAPLVFRGARVSMPSPTLFLAAPDGDYRILVGDPSAGPPDYEMARARDLVLAVRSVDATIGAASPNPAHVEPPWYLATDVETWLVWGVLALAILLLGFLTLRVTRQPPVPRESDEPAEPDAEPPERGEPPEC